MEIKNIKVLEWKVGDNFPFATATISNGKLDLLKYDGMGHEVAAFKASNYPTVKELHQVLTELIAYIDGDSPEAQLQKGFDVDHNVIQDNAEPVVESVEFGNIAPGANFIMSIKYWNLIDFSKKYSILGYRNFVFRPVQYDILSLNIVKYTMKILKITNLPGSEKEFLRKKIITVE